MKKYLENKIIKFKKDKDLFELLSGSATTLIVRCIGGVLGFLFMLLVTKGYGEHGPEVWGKYLLGLLILKIFVILARLGADTALLKFIASFNSQGLHQNIHHVYRKALTFVLPFSLLLSFLMYFFAENISIFISVPIFYVEYMSFFLLPLVWMFINTQSFRGLKDMLSFSFFYNSAVITFAFTFFLLAFIFFKKDILNNHQAPIYAYSIGIAIAFLFSLFLWLKKSKGTGYISEKNITNKQFLNVSIPLMLAQSITFIMGWTDQFMLGAMTTPEDVGIYGVAFKYSTLAIVFLMSINSIAAPKIAEFYANNDIQGLKKTVRHSTKMIFWITTPIVLVFLIFSKIILGFSGEEFKLGITALFILLSGRFFSSICGPVGVVLQMTNNQHIFQNILLIAAVFNISLNYFLIPIYGINGAAFASFASLLFWNIVMVIVVKKKFGFYSFYFPILTK